MTPVPSSSLQMIQCLAFASLFVLALPACGSSPDPLGESQQPISGDGFETPAGDACEGGVPPAEASEGACTITARALCFSSRQAACACAGCELDECAFAESFPEQAVCSSGSDGSDPDGPVSDDPDAPVSSEPGDGVSGSPGNGGIEPDQVGGGSDGHPGCDED